MRVAHVRVSTMRILGFHLITELVISWLIRVESIGLRIDGLGRASRSRLFMNHFLRCRIGIPPIRENPAVRKGVGWGYLR